MWLGQPICNSLRIGVQGKTMTGKSINKDSARSPLRDALQISLIDHEVVN
jgi:hypothetical protein